MVHLSGLSIRSRLITVIGLILVIGFLTTNIISFRVSSAALKATILHNELPLTSSNIYSEIQADLLRPIFVSSLMSNDAFLKDWLLAGEKDIDQVVRFLDEIRREYGVFTSFVVSEKTRKYYHFTGIAQVVDESDPEDVWFFRARKMDDAYEVNIDYNQAQGDAVTIFVNYRLLDYAGNFLGITGVGLEVDTVSRIVSRYRENFQRTILFIDGTGRIAVQAGASEIAGANIHQIEGLAGIADDLLGSDQAFFEYERDGETMLVTTRHIPELGWHVVVEQRAAVALRGLRQSFLTNLVIGIVIVVLSMVTIGYAVNVYQARLEEMATVDKLTGIGNRQAFDLAIEQAVKMGKRSTRPFSVILLDIDHFKSINDTLGHLRGDEVIRRLAAVARRTVRESDVLCRWGGEEFIVLAHDCALADAQEIAEKLRLAVAAEPLGDGGRELYATISAGVTEFATGDDADGIMGRADSALYRAKAEGRNRVATAPADTAAVMATV